MTRPVVIDASVAIALVLPEPSSDRWAHWARDRVREGRPIVVPAHFWLEVGNPLVARYRLAGADVVERFHALDDLVTETVEVGRATLLLAIDRAERFGLTLYDATYLAVAEVIEADLATADRSLERAAGDRFVGPTEAPEHRLSEPRSEYAAERAASWPDYSGVGSYLASLRVRLRADARG